MDSEPIGVDLKPQESPEVEIAKNGVEEYKKMFFSSDVKTRLWLLDSGEAQLLQCMFLGIKPASHFNNGELTRVNRLSLPSRFRRKDNHIYDPEKVKETVTANPDVFPDYKPEDDINEYVKPLFSNGERSEDPEQKQKRVAQIGILYGFPKQAALDYGKFNPERSELVNHFMWMRHRAIDPNQQFGPIARETILHFTLTDSKGNHVPNVDYLNKFLDQNRSEVREYLKGINSYWDEETLNYVLDLRGQDIRGFHLGSTNSAELDEFKKKVEITYHDSGMDAFLKRSRFWTRLGK